jgi:hypothetical protein
VAVWAGTNVAVAEPAAAGALLLGAVWLALAIQPRLRRMDDGIDPTQFEGLTFLGDAFEEGAMGRQTIIATISGLDSEVFGSRHAALGLDEEMRLSRASPREFREWVNVRLTELEGAT